MPKSFLFTHRRYNVTPTDESSECEKPQTYLLKKEAETSANSSIYSSLPPSPGRAVEPELISPGRPQPARVTSLMNNLSTTHIPEEMFNLIQLAEVSLASSSTEFRSVMERWHKKQREDLVRVLKHPKVRRNLEADCKITIDIPTENCLLPLDKPLDLRRDQNEVRMLTPSPSPTPSETRLSDHSNIPKNMTEDTRAIETPSPKAQSKINENHQEGHECPECGKRYSTSSNLARHRQTHRSPADQKARRCPHCDKVYVSVPAFSMHVRTHSQGCKCPYCGKSFSRPWLLQGHIRTHTGEKPFCCHICEKAFADKSNLRAHIQTHSNLKPYTCERCGKAFALKSYLYKHEESSCMKMTKTKVE